MADLRSKVIECEGGALLRLEGNRIGARLTIDHPNVPNLSALMTRARAQELRDALNEILGEGPAT